jgi:hypothetical protein
MKSPMRRWPKAPTVLCWALAAIGSAAHPARAAAQFDFCSTVVIRPDQNYLDPATCANSYSDQAIAAGADAVWLGDFTDVAHPVIPAPPGTCRPSPSHSANAAYVQRLKAARALLGKPPLEIVHMHRFDLLPAPFMALPAFHPSYLATAIQPWSAVTGFFTNDTSSSCAVKPCRWSDSWGGMEGKDTGVRMRDFIDKQSGAGGYTHAVYYLARPDASKVFWPTSALADLRNPDYRAWRVAEAKEGLRLGGYTTIDLNHKLHQYQYGAYSIGTRFSSVAAVEASGDTVWSASPAGYGYTEYVQGLAALAQELRAAGVPYSFTIPLRSWSGDSFDDKTTTGLNEANLIRDIMLGAKVVYLDRPTATTPAGMLESATADLAARGVRAIAIDGDCGLRIDKPLAAPGTPQLLP